VASKAVLSVLLITFASSIEAAPAFTVLYSFQFGSPNGYNPWSNVVKGPDGVLYGTTFLGGPGGDVYSLTPPASPAASWTEAFYGFPSMKAGSDVREGVVVGPYGDLYGTTIDGGSCGYGNVFEVKPPQAPGGSWTLEELVSFCPTSDSAAPLSPDGTLICGPDGVLYGTTLYGGTANNGTVFSLTRPAEPGGAWTEAVLYSFQGGSDGSWPQAGVVVGSGGVLYGTTVTGGTGACDDLTGVGCGTVYSLTPPASPGGSWTEAVIYSFQGGSDGANPADSVVSGPNGTLYGTTQYGGGVTTCAVLPGNCGAVFSLTPPASPGGSWTENVLFRFTGADGANPNGGVIIDGRGILYGTALDGGSSNAGTVFSLSPPSTSGGAWTQIVLHDFTSGSDGARPFAGLTFGGPGILYGTASGGGISNAGTVFSLTTQ
jgi:uncharacterized repeat protein (TIGR03803 family)